MAKSKKVTDAELKDIRESVNLVNSITTRIGQVELSKHKLITEFQEAETALKNHQKSLHEKYGEIHVNLDDGTITEKE